MRKTTHSKNKLPWLTRPENGVPYSVQAPGPHVPGYQLAVSPGSCLQLESDASTVRQISYNSISKLYVMMICMRFRFQLSCFSRFRVCWHFFMIDMKAENLLHQKGRELRPRQAFKSILSLVWPWPLTSWPQSWSFHAPALQATCANLMVIDSFAFKISCSQVWFEQTEHRKQYAFKQSTLVDLARKRGALLCTSASVNVGHSKLCHITSVTDNCEQSIYVWN